MAKQTKRQRKFQATGGVKKRIEKGTITKGGKIRKRKARTNDGATPKNPAIEPQRSDRSDDLMGKDNLGDLDMDSFFAQFSENADQAGNDDDGSSQESKELSKEGSDDEMEDVDADPEAKRSSSDSEGDDSDDDDIEAVEARMKAEMSKIQRSDPDFHQFLKENEESLLEFGGDADDKDDAHENDDEVDVTEKTGGKSGTQDGAQLTPQLLASLAKGTFNSHGVKSLKKLIGAYKSACHLADTIGESTEKHRPGESGQIYVIDSSKVFDELMVLCLNNCHKEFTYHLLGKRDEVAKADDKQDEDEQEESQEDEHSKPLNPKTLEKAARWIELKPILHSFFRSTLHVMSQAKEPELLAFILKALSKYLRFMTPFPRVAEAMLKSLTGLWSAPLDSSEDYQVVRLNAFLRIRQLALTQPFPFIEDCLKKTYLAYTKRAKFGSSVMNSPTLPTLTFMGNCLVELYCLDFHSSYQHAFVYIRQLALLLRTAMHKKTPESMQQVFCWQYVHCLKLWVAVLSAAAPADDGALMRSLIFPLTEIILGTVRFVPSPVRHMPLRFHCVRLLQQLAAAAEVFIPTTSLLLDCLEWKEWYLAPKKTKSNRATRGLQLHLMLKLGKEDPLRTHEQLEAGINEFFVLINREVELYRYSAGFPEFSIRIVTRLRHFAKEVRNPRWRTYAKACIDVCDKYSAFAVQARSKLHEAPRDVKLLECLKPVSEKNMRDRHEESIVKEQKALETSRPPEVTKKSAKDEVDEEDDDDMEEETKASKKRKLKQKRDSKKQTLNKEELEKQLMGDDELMGEQDDVKEGVDWSDEED
jgi:nucleolar complex protein 2